MATVTVKPVAGFGVRINLGSRWVPIYTASCSAGDKQIDPAKFKNLTLCSLESEAIEVHVAVFHRSTFTGSVLTTEYNAATKGVFLHHKLRLGPGATFEINDFYMDTFLSSSECEDGSDQPIVAIWIDGVEELSSGLDVIHRR